MNLVLKDQSSFFFFFPFLPRSTSHFLSLLPLSFSLPEELSKETKHQMPTTKTSAYTPPSMQWFVYFFSFVVFLCLFDSPSLSTQRDHLQNPSPYFADVITTHFRIKKEEIIEQLGVWLRESNSTSLKRAVKEVTDLLGAL